MKPGFQESKMEARNASKKPERKNNDTQMVMVGRRRTSHVAEKMPLLFYFLSVLVFTGMANADNNVAAMFVMGDSSVDCGENTLFYPLFHHNLSLLPCNSSSASLLPHLLAKKIGFGNIPSFYSQNGSVAGVLQGLNYGSAQATILNPTSTSHQSLNQQLRQLFETIQLLQLQLGDETARHFVKSSIFYLSFGKDDYINLFLHNSSGIMLNYSGKAFAHILVSLMVDEMMNMYDAGVQKIICAGILPLGCTPRAVSDGDDDDGDYPRGCHGEINELILEYNSMLEYRIEVMNSALPDANMIFIDVYQGIMNIITNHKLYGFREIENACCGVGTSGCLSIEMACKDSSDYVWWDLYNPTEAVNSLLADSVWSGKPLSNISRPLTVHDMVYTSVPT